MDRQHKNSHSSCASKISSKNLQVTYAMERVSHDNLAEGVGLKDAQTLPCSEGKNRRENLSLLQMKQGEHMHNKDEAVNDL